MLMFDLHGCGVFRESVAAALTVWRVLKMDGRWVGGEGGEGVEGRKWEGGVSGLEAPFVKA